MSVLIKQYLVFIFSLFTALPAVAHGDMDRIFDSMEAPHGGRVRESGGYQVELVVRQNSLNVYVATVDKMAPIDLSTSSATALIVHDGRKEMVDLEYREGALTTKSEFGSLEMATVAIVIKLENGRQFSAKFLPKNTHH